MILIGLEILFSFDQKKKKYYFLYTDLTVRKVQIIVSANELSLVNVLLLTNQCKNTNKIDIDYIRIKMTAIFIQLTTLQFNPQKLSKTPPEKNK